MDRFHELSAFIAVAEAGGFSAAARQTGEAQPAISKAVAALEKRFGAALFNRSTRSVTLTDHGQRYLERTRLGVLAGVGIGISTEASLVDELADPDVVTVYADAGAHGRAGVHHRRRRWPAATWNM